MDSIQLFTYKSAFGFRRALAAFRLPFALAIGAALLLAAAFVFHVISKTELKAAQASFWEMSKRTLPAASSGTGSAPMNADLKSFRSSHLLAILEQGASTANLKLDEISFAIDDSPNQPFVRYRATFTVLSRYPTIRKFISEILAGSEGVVLDTVACRREDINVADVRCDISAYVAYQEKAGG